MMKKIFIVVFTFLLQNVFSQTIDMQSNDINGNIHYTNVDNVITVSFDAIADNVIPTYNAISLVGSTTNSYVDNKVTFNLKCNSNNIANVRLVLKGTSGRLWRNEYVNVSTNSLWINNSIGLTYADGWTRDGVTDLKALWNLDIQSVEYIGIRISQPDNKEVSYSVADFAVGTNMIALSPLERALTDTFGVSNTNSLSQAQWAQDTDADGMVDAVEILSEYNKAFADSIFMLELTSVNTNGANLKWTCVNSHRYTLKRTASLNSPFENVPNAVGKLSSNTGYMKHTDPVTNKTYFYRVIRLGQ